MQTTCRLTDAGLRAAAARLAPLVANAAAPGQVGDAKLTFAVAYKERHVAAAPGGPGGKAAATKAAGEAGADGESEGGHLAAEGASPPVPQRGAAITALATGLQAGAKALGVELSVNLTQPDVVLVAEALPVGGTPYASLALLPRALCQLKPRLVVRATGGEGAGK